MTIDDEVRATLARRAEDVHTSADAWDVIAARLDEPQRSARRLATFAGAAVAAALVAGVIVVSQNDSPEPPVTASTTTTPGTFEPFDPADIPARVWEGDDGQDARTVAESYLKNRTGVQVTTADYESIDDTHVVGRFAAGGVASELWLERYDNHWLVVSSASDLIPIHDPLHDHDMLTGVVTVEATGTLQLGYGDGRNGWDEPHEVQAGESVPVRQASVVPHPAEMRDFPGSIRALLRTSDGTVALSEVTPTNNPVTAAKDYLSSLSESYLDAGDKLGFSFDTGEFEQGDTTSGEVKYTLNGGRGGTVLLRQAADRNWHAFALTSELLSVTATQAGDELEVQLGEAEADRIEISAEGGSRPVCSSHEDEETCITDDALNVQARTSAPGRTETFQVGGVIIDVVKAVAYKGTDIVAIAVVPVS